RRNGRRATKAPPRATAHTVPARRRRTLAAAHELAPAGRSEEAHCGSPEKQLHGVSRPAGKARGPHRRAKTRTRRWLVDPPAVLGNRAAGASIHGGGHSRGRVAAGRKGAGVDLCGRDSGEKDRFSATALPMT